MCGGKRIKQDLPRISKAMVEKAEKLTTSVEVQEGGG